MSESPDLEATEEIPRSSMYDAMLRLAMEPSKREADVRLSEQWTPMPAAELANLLPQWNINAHHNSGFMAAVYRGRQTQPDREVAVKVLRPELRANEEARARFHREGEILAKLVHSNVVQVLEYGDAGADDSAISYLVMVFVHGTSLAERIKHEALPVPLALSLMKQLLPALAHIHRQGVCHRDLKPANIIVKEGDVPVIIDLGIAYLTERFGTTWVGAGSDFQTQPGVLIGTLRYLAPELLNAASGVKASAVTDIYAMGKTLADMLCGYHRLDLQMPTPELQRFVDKACHTDPCQRFQSAEAMLAAVEQLGRPLPPPLPKPPPLPAASSPVVGATRFAINVGRACLATTPRRLVLLVGCALYFLWPRSPGPATATAERPYVNSLGMKFVRVPGRDAAISLRRVTREQYSTFVSEVGGLNDTWRTARFSSIDPIPTSDDAVCGISEIDASHFCTWLTKREANGIVYRLPDSDEWRAAMATKWEHVLDNPFPKQATMNSEALAEARYFEHLQPNPPTHLGLRQFSLTEFEWARTPGASKAVVLAGYLEKPTQAVMIGFEQNQSTRSFAGGSFTLKTASQTPEVRVEVVPWFYFRIAIDLRTSDL